MGSGIDGFAEALKPYRKVTVDTDCCIYRLARQPSDFRTLARHLFTEAGLGRLEVELPGIVRLELLVRPYGARDMAELNRVRELMEFTPGVCATGVSEDILTAAAAVRAQTRMKAPDALVAGSALVNQSEAIVGNDKVFTRLRDLAEISAMDTGRRYNVPAYIHLDDYLEEE